VARATSLISHSPISFDSPYGDSGAFGESSVTSSVVGVPYTAAEEENTSLSTPARSIALSTLAVPVTFCA